MEEAIVAFLGILMLYMIVEVATIVGTCLLLFLLTCKDIAETIREDSPLAILGSAWAFLMDPEARVLSGVTYPNGNGMSVREARKRGLIP